MAGDFIAILKENLGASRISTVRGSNIRQSNRANSTMSANATRTWFKQQASGPNLPGSGEVKWSNFRAASVVAGRAVGDPESVTTYADAKDGEVEIYLCCQSVVTDANGRKNYGFNIAGTVCTKVENVSSPDATKRSLSKAGLAHGTYAASAYDGSSPAASTISAQVVVGYGGSKTTYENLH